MKCKQVHEMLGPYLYGDLGPDEMKEVRLHTQECAACREDLASRGRVVSALDANAPELSDDDRQRIAWTVKGAIRSKEMERAGSGRKWVPSLAFALLLLGCVVAWSLLNSPSHKSPLSMDQARRPVVTVTEEKADDAKNATSETPPRLAPKTEDEGAPDTMAEIAHRLGTVGVASSRSNPGRTHKKTVTPDKPAPVVRTPEEEKPVPAKDVEKLPEPTDLNNAQTSTGDEHQ